MVNAFERQDMYKHVQYPHRNGFPCSLGRFPSNIYYTPGISHTNYCDKTAMRHAQHKHFNYPKHHQHHPLIRSQYEGSHQNPHPLPPLLPVVAHCRQHLLSPSTAHIPQTSLSHSLHENWASAPSSVLPARSIMSTSMLSTRPVWSNEASHSAQRGASQEGGASCACWRCGNEDWTGGVLMFQKEWSVDLWTGAGVVDRVTCAGGRTGSGLGCRVRCAAKSFWRVFSAQYQRRHAGE